MKKAKSALGFALVSLAGAVHADTVSLPAIADTSIYSESLHGNGAGDALYAGMPRNNETRRALLRFDVASLIPAGAQLTSATLHLSMVQSQAGVFDFTVHRALSSWEEGLSTGLGQGGPATTGEATWEHRFFDTTTWNTKGGDFEALPSATTTVSAVPAIYSWSGSGLVADVQTWVNHPGTNYGWFLLGNETAFQSVKKFGSSEHANALFHPTLVVTFTAIPEPSTSVALFGATALLLGVFRRRRIG
jgi:hypothetical protein